MSNNKQLFAACQRHAEHDEDASSVCSIAVFELFGAAQSSDLEWKEVCQCPDRRSNPAVLATDDAVVLIGGWTGVEHVQHCAAFLLASQTWLDPVSISQRWPALPIPVSNALAQCIEEDIFIVGGDFSSERPVLMLKKGKCCWKETELNTWSNCSCCVVGTRLVVAGGEADFAMSDTCFSVAIGSRDIPRSIRALPNLPKPMSSMALSFFCGSLVLAGGYVGSTTDARSSCEQQDMVGVWHSCVYCTRACEQAD